VEASTNHRRNARSLRAFSLLSLGLLAAALLVVHHPSYGPAVSFVLLYSAVAVGVAAAVTLLLLPVEQFTAGFGTTVYVLYALLVTMAVFFSGGVSSDLYLLYFPLLAGAVLHGSWRTGLPVLLTILVSYSLAVLPDITGTTGAAAPVLFRLLVLLSAAVFILAGRRYAEAGRFNGEYVLDEDGSLLLERVSGELAHRGERRVAVMLLDPGPQIEDVDLLLEMVRSRIGEPVLLGDGTVFGLVLRGTDDRAVENAARRALAAASSLGAREVRVGAAVYPRDARAPGDLLSAAGRALEAAFRVESPSAIVVSGRVVEGRYRAAR
jgi:hypothetical protein